MSVQYYNPTGLNGDMKRGGQIAHRLGRPTTGINNDAHVLVPRENNITKYYPAISNDDALVVYQPEHLRRRPRRHTRTSRRACGVYGAQTCDGYDDSSATLWLDQPDGLGAATPRQRQRRCTNDNSWPRWSPDNGTFRGQQALLAGVLVAAALRLAGEQRRRPMTTKPQLWFAGGAEGGEIGAGPELVRRCGCPTRTRDAGAEPDADG